MGFISFAKEEFQVVKERDPAIKSPMEVLPHIPCYVKLQAGPQALLKGAFFPGKVYFPEGGQKNRD